jgi:tungstate transport system permease protein
MIIESIVTALQLILDMDRGVMEIALRSVTISGSATFVSAIIFIPFGGLIYFYSFKFKNLVVGLINTFFSVPTVFVGLVIFAVFSKEGPLGGFGMLFTPGVMLIGQVILIAPIIAGMTISALNGVRNDIKETSLSLGANKMQVIYSVIKEARYGVITGLLLAFGRAISEVGLAIMVGGNIKHYTRTLTTSMSLETSMGNLGMSMALGIILITVALAVNLIGNRLQNR